MAIGKTAPNGTLNADGAFYSVQDVNVLLENAGGGGGGELPTPTVADAGKAVVVDDEGKYSLGEAGGGDGLLVTVTRTEEGATLNKNYSEIKTALTAGKSVVFLKSVTDHGATSFDGYGVIRLFERTNNYVVFLYAIDTENDNAIFTEPYFSETDTGVLTYTNGG